jgi:hypothetical protein
MNFMLDQVKLYTVHGKTYEQQHGNPFDRGSADSYYGRPRDPHWYPEGSYKGTRVEAEQMSDAQLESYHAGYDYNEQFGDKKSWD